MPRCNAKLKTFLKDLAPVIEMAPDALIMSDPGLIMLVRRHFPDMPIHLSVQANTVNWASVQFWQHQGVARVMPAHQHDQARVGHDQRIRRHFDHRCQVFEKGLELGVVRGDVDDHVETLAQGMGLLDAQRQIGMVEFVVAHPQAVARLAGIDRIGTIGEGVAHGLEGAGRGQQFGLGKRGHGRTRGKRRGCYGLFDAAILT